MVRITVCYQSAMPQYVFCSEAPPPVEGTPTLAESILLRIFRRFPPKHNSIQDLSAHASAEYEDERGWPFWRFFGRGPELFEGRDVLDLGCGWGGRSVYWLEVGANSVCGVDTDTQVALARAFARGRRRSRFEIGTGEAIPCEDGSFDLVVMNDVMEHVVDPEQVVAECHRVLRPGRRLRDGVSALL